MVLEKRGNAVEQIFCAAGKLVTGLDNDWVCWLWPLLNY